METSQNKQIHCFKEKTVSIRDHSIRNETFSSGRSVLTLKTNNSANLYGSFIFIFLKHSVSLINLLCFQNCALTVIEVREQPM